MTIKFTNKTTRIQTLLKQLKIRESFTLLTNIGDSFTLLTKIRESRILPNQIILLILIGRSY